MSKVVAYRLAELVAGVAVNCRPGDDDVSDLVASIRAHGLIQPLVGRALDDGRIEIVDGNRRLRALMQIDAEDDVVDISTIERVEVNLLKPQPDADAFEISLAANVLRKALHPVAEYEAFAQLAERGKSTEEIAAHFGITLRQVEQRQALGQLHEDVRKAWLEGKITGEAARAFTLAEPGEQAAYLASARSHELHPGNVRQAFSRESVPATRPVALFVGEGAYRAAGGEMVRDLFADKQEFADGGLLQRLAGEKLAAIAAEVKQAEGWGEVLYGPDTQEWYRWSRIPKPALPEEAKIPRRAEIATRLRAIDERAEEIEGELEEAGFDGEDEASAPPEIKALLDEADALAAERQPLSREYAAFDDERAAWLTLPAEKRAKAITTVEIGHDGEVQIARGFLKGQQAKADAPPKPTAMAAPKPASGGDDAPEPTRLSAALMDDLALTATRAAAHVLAVEPRIALAAFVATHATWGTPIRLTSAGRGEGPDLAWPAREHDTKLAFAAVFRAVLVLPIEDLQIQAAHMIARTLDFTSKALAYHSYDSLKPDAVTVLRAALPADAHRVALAQAFDAETYFKAAPKQEAIAAIRDCGDDPGKHAKLKKGDLAAVAARMAKDRAWLPPLLRGEVFDAVLPQAETDGDSQAPNEWDAAAPSEPESVETAAEAADRIWKDQDGGEADAEIPADSYDEMKAPALRDLLKTAGVKVPFGATREVLLQLVRDRDRGPVEEAA